MVGVRVMVGVKVIVGVNVKVGVKVGVTVKVGVREGVGVGVLLQPRSWLETNSTEIGMITLYLSILPFSNLTSPVLLSSFQRTTNFIFVPGGATNCSVFVVLRYFLYLAGAHFTLSSGLITS